MTLSPQLLKTPPNQGPGPHQITFSFTFQLFPRLIQDSRSYSKEWQGLEANRRQDSRRGSTRLWLNSTSLKKSQSPKFLTHIPPTHYLGKMPLTQLQSSPGPPKGASLTAEPGFMGVAPGRGVNIWPPCGNQRSGVWVSLFPYSPWTPAFWTSYSPSLSARRCPRWSSAGHLPPGSTTARPQGWWAHPLCLTPVRIPGYTLGKGVGREEGSEYHWGPERHAQALLLPPPLFPTRELE